MGGRISKAKRACLTSKTETLNVDKLSGSVSVTKNYDTTCVTNRLDK